MTSPSIALVSSLEGFLQGLKPAYIPHLVCPLQPFLLLRSLPPAIDERLEVRGDDQRDYQRRERGPAEDRELLRALQSGLPHDRIDTVVYEEEPPEGEYDGGNGQNEGDGLVSDKEHTLQLMAGRYQLKQANDGYEYKNAVLPGAYNFQGDP